MMYSIKGLRKKLEEAREETRFVLSRSINPKEREQLMECDKQLDEVELKIDRLERFMNGSS